MTNFYEGQDVELTQASGATWIWRKAKIIKNLYRVQFSDPIAPHGVFEEAQIRVIEPPSINFITTSSLPPVKMLTMNDADHGDLDDGGELA